MFLNLKKNRHFKIEKSMGKSIFSFSIKGNLIDLFSSEGEIISNSRISFPPN